MLANLFYILTSSYDRRLVRSGNCNCLKIDVSGSLRLSIIAGTDSSSAFRLRILGISKAIITAACKGDRRVTTGPVALRIKDCDLCTDYNQGIGTTFKTPFCRKHATEGFSVAGSGAASIGLIYGLTGAGLSIRFPSSFTACFASCRIDIAGNMKRPLIFDGGPRSKGSLRTNFSLSTCFTIAKALI